MCNCRTDIEKRLTDHYASKLSCSRDVDAKLMGYALRLGKHIGLHPYMPVEIRHTVTVKATGADKRKTVNINMYFSHCPFCGEKLQKDE